MLEKLPLLALSLCDCAITVFTHGQGLEKFIRPWPERISAALLSLVNYLVQFFVPTDLAIFYPFPAAGYSFGQVAGAALAVGHLRGRGFLAACLSLWVCRLVLVLGNDVAGPRPGLHLRSRAGRPLHVPAGNWTGDRGSLAAGTVGQPIADRALVVGAAGAGDWSDDQSVDRANFLLPRRHLTLGACTGRDGG